MKTVYSRLYQLFIFFFVQPPGQQISDRILTVPNVVTAFGLVAIFFYAAAYNQLIVIPGMWIVLSVVLVGVSDLLDGLAARLLDQHTHVGKILDPVRDRLLGLAVLINFIVHSPQYTVLILVGGTVTIELGIGAVHYSRIKERIQWRAKHTSGKVRQAVHLIAAGIFVFQEYLPGLSGQLHVPIALIVGVMFFASLYAFIALEWN